MFKIGRRYKTSGKYNYNGWWLRDDDSLWENGISMTVDVDESTVLLILDSREVLDNVGIREEAMKLCRDVKVLTQKGLIGWVYLKLAEWVEIPDNT